MLVSHLKMDYLSFLLFLTILIHKSLDSSANLGNFSQTLNKCEKH